MSIKINTWIKQYNNLDKTINKLNDIIDKNDDVINKITYNIQLHSDKYVKLVKP